MSASQRRPRIRQERRPRRQQSALLRLFEAIWEANARGDQNAVALLVARGAAAVMGARRNRRGRSSPSHAARER